ncbi:protein ROOT HAIR DEFECTIVE 3-like isoform X4 [Carex rostrata]
MAFPGETQMKSGEETVKALPGKIQMIRGDGHLFYSEAETFVEELKTYSSASDNYTVVSIIGPQGSGKSYLLNTLFSTKFDVLNAKKGRKQTTKGIWIAKCNDPCMIIMDVEGCDGRERGEDGTLFEKQSALFSLTLSDVLLVNMWYKDIDRQNGGSYGLIKIIFEQRAKIEAPKTTIIILVRDYDDETPLDITKKDLKERMNELWDQVHPASKGLKMSDYIKVKVKDFPNKSQEQEFTQKSKDLAQFLCNNAASGSSEQKHCASSFAYSSQIIWDLICKNKRLSAADHKLAMATYLCSQIKNEILESFDEDTGYRSLTSGTSMSVIKFNTELSLFLDSIFSRYEEDTSAHDRNTMEKVKLELQKETLKAAGTPSLSTEVMHTSVPFILGTAHTSRGLSQYLRTKLLA